MSSDVSGRDTTPTVITPPPSTPVREVSSTSSSDGFSPGKIRVWQEKSIFVKMIVAAAQFVRRTPTSSPYSVPSSSPAYKVDEFGLTLSQRDILKWEASSAYENSMQVGDSAYQEAGRAKLKELALKYPHILQWATKHLVEDAVADTNPEKRSCARRALASIAQGSKPLKVRILSLLNFYLVVPAGKKKSITSHDKIHYEEAWKAIARIEPRLVPTDKSQRPLHEIIDHYVASHGTKPKRHIVGRREGFLGWLNFARVNRVAIPANNNHWHKTEPVKPLPPAHIKRADIPVLTHKV